MFKFSLTTNLFYFDPLEQFDILNLVEAFEMSPSNLVLFTVIWLILTFRYYLAVINFWPFRERNSASWLGLTLYSWARNIEKGNLVLPYHFVIFIAFFAFLFFLSTNLFGLIPFSYTIASFFWVALFISLAAFITVNVLAIYNHGFFPLIGLLLPKGVPFLVGPLLIVIELISYFARLFSLAIRLFANMMAGHTLLKILIGFSFIMLMSLAPVIPFAIFPWLVVTLIIVLEILISMLQAYVFTILICVYFNDAVLSH